MPKRNRSKPSSHLISDDIYKEIISIRPLRLFISKQKKKGSTEKPFNLRSQFCRLPSDKQIRYLQRAVDKYIELLDEKDVDEHVQVECKLFDYLLTKTEQKKYFESINAPSKPAGQTEPYYSQLIKEEHDEDNETSWKSLSTAEQKSYKKRRKEAIFEYSAQVRNFANDLPERLQTDYLLFGGQSIPKLEPIDISMVNGHTETNNSQPIRQRRKSLAVLPDSLQTSTITTTSSDDGIQTKLTRIQLDALHRCIPSVLYYETTFPNETKPAFTKAKTKNAYIRSLYLKLDEKERLKYVLKAIKKWNEFLNSNPDITEHQIPTLHLLLSRNKDRLSYFCSMGLPRRPPNNCYIFFNDEKKETGSQQSWTDLSQTDRHEYSQQLTELKNDYYQKLVTFVDQILPSDYMRYEFFRNIKFAVKDYELATKSEIQDKTTGQIIHVIQHGKQLAIDNDKNQLNQIKEKLLATRLTNEQKNLFEELSRLLVKYIK